MNWLDVARTDAERAAAAADVHVAAVSTPDELDDLQRTMESIWGPEIVPPRNLLRGMALSGNCLLVAWRHDQPIGFALGWLGWDGGVHFHTHQVGVQAGDRGAGVGFALKLAQRMLCLEHDITEMRWTYDPMLLSNARFNLGRLGARVVGFLPHCYGDRRDAFNTGDTTDRVEVSWRLDRAIGGDFVAPADADFVVPIPPNYHALRVADPPTADALRRQVGAALSDVFATGRTVAGLCEHGYVVQTER